MDSVFLRNGNYFNRFYVQNKDLSHLKAFHDQVLTYEFMSRVN